MSDSWDYERIIAMIVGVIGLAVCGISSSVVQMEMVDEVNRVLPESERFSLFGWHPAKLQRLRLEHARLYPASGLRKKWWMTIGIGLVCLAISGLTLFAR